MKKVFILFLAWCVLFQSTAFTAAYAASQEVQKESIVLLPINGQGMSENELAFFRDAVAKGLSSNYTIKYGEQVDKVVQDIFAEESKTGLDCDQTRCYRDIATMLKVNLIAKATIIPLGGDYQVSLVVYNVYENKSVMTQADVCEKCGRKQLVDKLVELASGGKGGGALTPAAMAEAKAKAAEAERRAKAEAKAEEERNAEEIRKAARERLSAAEQQRKEEAERKAAAQQKAEADRKAKADRMAAEEATSGEGGVKWYWWALGALAVGGIAAAAGGSKGGGGGSSNSTGSPPAATSAPLTVHW